jgi:hypothetical protein
MALRYFYAEFEKEIKMKYIKLSSFFIWLGALLATLLSSCNIEANRASGNTTEVQYQFENFSRIEMEGGYSVQIQQGEVSSISVFTKENLQKRVIVKQNGETLKIKTPNNEVSTQETRLLITISKLNVIKVRGGANIETIGELNLDTIKLDVEGGANIRMDINANILEANSKGGVNMDFRGTVDQFIASTEGAGNIDAGKLEARYVKCRVAGVGNAVVYALEELDATVEGIGKIGYRGSPNVKKNVNGIGLVYRR